jgi:hypothetical protein
MKYSSQEGLWKRALFFFFSFKGKPLRGPDEPESNQYQISKSLPVVDRQMPKLEME